MNPYLKVSGLDATTCAGLLGYSPRLFQEWAAGQRPIPPSIAAHISSVLGVETSDLLTPGRKPLDETAIEPAVWFKLRSQGLGSADRELVLLVRQLGTFYEELEQIRSETSSSWKVVFEQVRQEINAQAPPGEQGRIAAQVFRRLREWNKGRSGIGELLRGSLRSLGILIVESPIADSKIEGCAFPVGASQRPCIFANTHNTTWFRRNAVILHELAHLIFDLGSEGAALDVFDSPPSKDELSERRAEVFAQEAAVPHEVLAHIAQRHGISWKSPISADSLALIVADAHMEPRLIVKSAIEHGLLEQHQRDSLLQLPIWDRLKRVSDHALSTKEYLAKAGRAADDWSAKRNTTILSRKLMLPVNYVNSVVESCREHLISIGRAARLLMISEDTFLERFDTKWLLDEK
jgi:Zn-dependent peptidase ImmA (M78 family)